MPNRANRILIWITVGAIIAAVFVPLYVSQTLFFPFISGKNFAFRILAEVAFAAWLILILRNPAYRPRTSMVMWSVAAFGAVLAVATLLAEDPYKSFWSNFERMEGFVGIVHFALFFLVAASLFRAKEWRLFALTALGVNTFIVGYALLQFFGFFFINQGGVRVDATFGNAIYLGVYALFHTFLAVYVAFSAHKEGRRLWLVGLFVILALGNVVVVILSATRGAVLGLFMGLLMLCIFLACSRSTSPTFRRAGIIGCVLAVLAIGGFFAARAVPLLKNHPVFGRVLSVSPINDDAKARFIIWGIALKGFKERPLFGWGQEGFNFSFNKYYDPRLFGREAWFDRAHNAYLDWLVAAGIFGILTYLALWISALGVVIRRQSGFSPPEQSLCIGFIAAYAVNNFFVFDNGVSYFFFFMLLAYLHYRNTVDPKSNHDAWMADIGETGKLPVLRGVAARVAASGIIVLLMLAVYWLNMRPAYAGALLIRALSARPEGPLQNLVLFKEALAQDTFATGEIREQLAQVTGMSASLSQVPIEVKREFLMLAVEETDKQIKQRPADARPYTFMGSLLDSFRLYDQGLLYWKEALALSPKKQMLMFQAGANRINAGKLSEGLPYIKEAYDLNPDNQEAVIVYAAGLIYAGDRATEQAILATPRYAKNPMDDMRLVNAYQAVGRVGDALVLIERRLTIEPDNQVFRRKLEELRSIKK